jgi:hypothetical protein
MSHSHSHTHNASEEIVQNVSSTQEEVEKLKFIVEYAIVKYCRNYYKMLFAEAILHNIDP